MLANAANPMVDASLRTLRPAAEQLRINIDIFDARSSTEVYRALQRLNDARPDGVLVAPDLLLLTQRTEIASTLAKYRLPAVYPFREYASVGGLMIHGANLGIDAGWNHLRPTEHRGPLGCI
jgi:putative ABC transport system substrate-binding protein